VSQEIARNMLREVSDNAISENYILFNARKSRQAVEWFVPKWN